MIITAEIKRYGRKLNVRSYRQKRFSANGLVFKASEIDDEKSKYNTIGM